jgi:hypothetical protein
MRRLLIPPLALLIVSIGAIGVAEETKSGLPVGESVGPFNVQDITGPNQGKSLCYR